MEEWPLRLCAARRCDGFSGVLFQAGAGAFLISASSFNQIVREFLRGFEVHSRDERAANDVVAVSVRRH
jgi:hypothetical protein